MSRNNKQIWKIAKYFHENIGVPIEIEGWGNPRNWFEMFNSAETSYNKQYVNGLYDKAAELLKKIQMNEFTEDDNHGD